MIPERFSLSNLEFDRYCNVKIRLRTDNNYYPILYDSNKGNRDSMYEYDIDGFRIPESIVHCGITLKGDAEEFYQVYEEHFEDYKLAIKKLLVKEML